MGRGGTRWVRVVKYGWQLKYVLPLCSYPVFNLEHLAPFLCSTRDLHFRFSVKFYTPDPGQLEEEYTRYLFALQMKRNLASGKLICNENTAALLASYIAQGWSLVEKLYSI